MFDGSDIHYSASLTRIFKNKKANPLYVLESDPVALDLSNTRHQAKLEESNPASIFSIPK